MSWFDAARTRARLLLSSRASEARTNEEFRFHLDMETDHLVRDGGLSRDEARRRALAAFGGVQNHRESMRDGRGTAWFAGLSLDLKLGFRMLVKYPGLTVVGGLAIAFGIWFGAVTIQMLGVVTGKNLPLPDGDRIVRIQNWDLKTHQDENRVVYDYQFWRSARSITDLGAYRDVSVNLVASGSAESAAAAEISASAFRIAPGRPVLGRVLAESDERAGAAPVVLLGHDLWTKRFDRDPKIVGRSVQIGGSFATIVGVMPEGYAFPVSHQVWLPLRMDVTGVEPRRGFPIKVFGRLAPGMTFEAARAEFTSLGKRIAAEHPTTHAQLQPHVLPYTQLSVNSGDETGTMALIYFAVVALVIVVCSTVALLLFARAAARETEILVRSALGASRRRIVTQLFAEALVLTGVAAVVGLTVAHLTLTRLGEPYLKAGLGVTLPFWFDVNLSPMTVLYALGLAVIGAVVAGVMPARKITRGLGTRLRAGTAGGGGLSFGGVWTAVIVTQVAVTVAFPLAVMVVRAEANRIESYDAGFPSHEYLGVKLGIDGPPAETLTPQADTALGTRFRTSVESLRERLEAQPGVAGVTIVQHLPGQFHSGRRADVVSSSGNPSFDAVTTSIHPGYFDVLQAPMLAGRAFTTADLSSDARVVIVDQAFADLVMPGRNVVGHYVRFSDGAQLDTSVTDRPWYEIVGVVKELGMTAAIRPERVAGLYLPLTPDNRRALNIIVHGRGNPLTLAPRIREVAASVDPALRVEQLMRLDQVASPELWFFGLWTRVMSGLTAVALLLSLSGIYAVLSYIVARRTREIGVRVALGASARRVVTSIYRRPLIQVTLGVIGGSVIIAVAAIAIERTGNFALIQPGGLTVREIAVLVGYTILMFGVCTLACVVPTVRALRVQPTEALRAE